MKQFFFVGAAALAGAAGEAILSKPKNEAFSRLFDEDRCNKGSNLPSHFFANDRVKIMTTKYMVAVALITPFLTVSSLAQQYEGGPKSSVPPTTSQISSGGDIYAQGVDVYAPAVYAPAVRANKSHAYQGGRKAAAK